MILANGNPSIYTEEALLLTQKYQLSEHSKTIEDDFKAISESDITRWFGGHKRSKGTENHEDSVFSRHNIVDPHTDEIMEMTSHDIRHWLNTIYQNGGLTEDQIALIFNRKHKQQDAEYDQISNKVRSERMKNAIRDKIAIGRVTATYSKLADFSREEAEDYLRSVTRMVNPMQHGVCMLD